MLRVYYRRPCKPGEVSIGGVQYSPMLNRQCGKVGVADQSTLGLTLQDHVAKKSPMLITRAQQPDVRLRQPLLYNLHRFFPSEPRARQPGIGHDAEECGHRLPGQPDQSAV